MEDSPSGLWRTLGKRVGVTASRVRISYPPPTGFSKQFENPFFMPGNGVLLMFTARPRPTNSSSCAIERYRRAGPHSRRTVLRSQKRENQAQRSGKNHHRHGKTAPKVKSPSASRTTALSPVSHNTIFSIWPHCYPGFRSVSQSKAYTRRMPSYDVARSSSRVMRVLG